MTPEFVVAEEAARAGGAIVARWFHEGAAMRSKGVANLVTDADLEAERAIVAVIKRHYPHHEVIAEELHAGDDSAEHLWLVDPIDGTNNFAHKVPHVAVSIAYYRAGRAECGVIVNPITADWYAAVRGGGATYNGHPARVSEEARLGDILVGVGFPYDRGFKMEATLAAVGDLIRREVHGIRRFGTAALDFGMVGRGLYGAYLEYELSPWDFAAGRLFVEEAGGRVTTALGNPLPLGGTTSVLASNGLVHDAVLEVVRVHHPDIPG